VYGIRKKRCDDFDDDSGIFASSKYIDVVKEVLNIKQD